MSETKPEPVAWMVRHNEYVELWTARMEQNARAQVKSLRKSYPDDTVDLRPLYDADVPALVEALRPLAEAAESYGPHIGDDFSLIHVGDTVNLTVGHLRRARTALATLDTEEDSNAPS